MTTHLSFDLETTGIDLDKDHIVCGATRLHRGDDVEVRLWHSDYADCMDSTTANELASYIIDAHKKDVAIVTFNGAKFDFAMLCRQVPKAKQAELVDVVLHHYDLMLDFAVRYGYFSSMSSFAEGCNLAPKTWNGLEASQAWAQNNLGDREKVVDYCAEDVRVLSELYEHVVFNAEAVRVTKAGRKVQVPFVPLLTVEESIRRYTEVPPDCSWMREAGPDITEGLRWLSA